MNHSDIPLARLVVDACKAHGIRNIVISPGSRSAPLAISFTSDPAFTTYSIVDERVAGFFGLGMARYLSAPVALVCTSGSALLNYYPAVVEAFYSQIPLVVISADRPFYKIDRGDGQTIRQQGVFYPHIGYEARLRQDISHATGEIRRFAPDYLEGNQEEINGLNRAEISEALETALFERLPIHLNTPFEEPLYGMEVREEHPIEGPLHGPETSSRKVDVPEELVRRWRESNRTMILVGVQSPSEELGELAEYLGDQLDALVFTETTSNMHHPAFLNSIDSIIAPIEKSDPSSKDFERLQPELLITIGGLVVSKKIKSFLRSYPPVSHWHLGDTRANDTFYKLEGTVAGAPMDALRELERLSPGGSAKADYRDYWMEKKMRFESLREAYRKRAPFSDYWVFSRIFDRIPSGYQLHLANSATVRYAQLFDLNDRYRVYCNRGTSGIEGSTSSAVGSAVHDPSPTLLISGDLSFFYDSNALWNAYTPANFRILLVNNGGGGIFRILPYTLDKAQYEMYFETTHGLNASHLCSMHGWHYKGISGAEEWEEAVDEFFSELGKPAILEVFTPRELNDKILLDYFKYLI